MMKGACSALAILLAANFVGACGLGGPPPVPSALRTAVADVQPTPTPPPDPSLVAYGYEVQDAGDGWNLGKAYLWFENQGETVTPTDLPPRACCSHNVKGAYVETEEGKTYPVKISSDMGFEHTEGVIDLRAVPGIPPGFRVSEGSTAVRHIKSRDYQWGRYVLEFKFAQAAHPTVIKFPTRPGWVIDLSQATAPEPGLATDQPDSAFQSIAALDGRVLVDLPDKLLITLGKCMLASESGGSVAYLTYTASNLDQLDGINATIPLPARAAIRRNREMWYGDAIATISLGPGQAKQDGIELFRNAGEVTHLVVYWPDGTHEVFNTVGCGR